MADGNGTLVSTSEIDTPVNDPHASLPPENSEQVVSPPTSPSSASTSRLNARAPEYVPRTSNNHGSKTAHHYHNQQRRTPRVMQIYNRRHGPQQPPPPPVIHLFPPHGPGFHAPAAIVPGYAASGFVEGEGGGRGMNDFDAVSGGQCAAGSGDLEEQFGGVSGDVARKITKQVEYYFSDVNLATTEHLMRFISKDHEGFVPITVIASFKKIKALVTNNVQLSTILRTSKKLVVSDDGKKVRRQQPITDSDLEELQARIVVSENLPVDHCYQSLVKVFSVVGSVKTIRTCYPQTTNGASHANPKPGKMDTFLFNRLHAFVEYETVEQAERAIEELNDEGNWRSGLRVRMLPSSMKHGNSRGRKAGHEGDENLDDDDGSSSKQPIEKQPEDHSQTIDVSQEEMGEHHEEVLTPRKGRVRGRGGRGRGRGHQYHNNHNSRGGSHPIGSPPSHSFQIEHHAASKPPGPQMPDGTRGFTKGRGKPLETTEVKP